MATTKHQRNKLHDQTNMTIKMATNVHKLGNSVIMQ